MTNTFFTCQVHWESEDCLNVSWLEKFHTTFGSNVSAPLESAGSREACGVFIESALYRSAMVISAMSFCNRIVYKNSLTLFQTKIVLPYFRHI